MGKTPKKPLPISFARELAKRMINLKDATIEVETMCDNSCQFINIIKGEHELCISFDGKGEMVTDISLNKQIKQVVDYERVWDC